MSSQLGLPTGRASIQNHFRFQTTRPRGLPPALPQPLHQKVARWERDSSHKTAGQAERNQRLKPIRAQEPLARAGPQIHWGRLSKGTSPDPPSEVPVIGLKLRHLYFAKVSQWFWCVPGSPRIAEGYIAAPWAPIVRTTGLDPAKWPASTQKHYWSRMKTGRVTLG